MTQNNALTSRVFIIIYSEILKANTYFSLVQFKNVKMSPLKDNHALIL
jgi:hypothetical protein